MPEHDRSLCGEQGHGAKSSLDWRQGQGVRSQTGEQGQGVPTWKAIW